MQVKETVSDGLKREFQVSVPAADIDAKVDERLVDLKDKVRLNGFRPGKVPVSHLKRVYGRSAMAEVIEATVRDANNQIVSERGYKLAAEPKVTMSEEKDAIEQLIAGCGVAELGADGEQSLGRCVPTRGDIADSDRFVA